MPRMTLTLDTWAAQLRDVLAHDDAASGLTRAARLLANALADPDFVAAQFAQNVGMRKVLYQDAELGFCIVAHEFLGARTGVPHDHGPSWAIYGQAAGETEMRDFEPLAESPVGTPRKVRMTRRYRMQPGDVHVYGIGDIHAPSRTAPTRLLRIEGMNLAHEARSVFEIVQA